MITVGSYPHIMCWFGVNADGSPYPIHAESCPDYVKTMKEIVQDAFDKLKNAPVYITPDICLMGPETNRLFEAGKIPCPCCGKYLKDHL